MKKPTNDMPDELWRYLRSRYSHRSLKAMFSRLYKPNGKREIERHSKFFQQHGHNGTHETS